MSKLLFFYDAAIGQFFIRESLGNQSTEYSKMIFLHQRNCLSIFTHICVAGVSSDHRFPDWLSNTYFRLVWPAKLEFIFQSYKNVRWHIYLEKRKKYH